MATGFKSIFRGVCVYLPLIATQARARSDGVWGFTHDLGERAKGVGDEVIDILLLCFRERDLGENRLDQS